MEPSSITLRPPVARSNVKGVPYHLRKKYDPSQIPYRSPTNVIECHNQANSNTVASPSLFINTTSLLEVSQS